MRIICLYLSLFHIALYASADILLETTLGQVKGFVYETTTPNVNAEVFLNIPYAKPPVGDLRFEKPQPAAPWSSPIDGTKFGACCVPHARAGVLPSPYFPAPDEDCLTLNVIRPQKEAPIGGYPILVWVHGGGYEIGSASLYGYKGFGNIYISQDVIIVTVQYRIGVYGFLSTGTKELPGNLGMFDLALAVKFIYDNAEWWGADKSRITYWGLSAGGALVGQLAMSPYARDYFPPINNKKDKQKC